MKPNHKCDPARMDLLYIRQQFICTTFKFDAYNTFLYIKILVSEQRNTTCEIALKYHKIWIIRNDKKDYRNIL